MAILFQNEHAMARRAPLIWTDVLDGRDFQAQALERRSPGLLRPEIEGQAHTL